MFVRYNMTQNGGIVGRKIRNVQCKVEFLGVIRSLEHFKARKATGSEFDKTLVLCLVHYSKFLKLFSEFWFAVLHVIRFLVIYVVLEFQRTILPWR